MAKPSKYRKIGEEFDQRLAALCAEYTPKLGIVNVASTMVVHTARACAVIAPEFMPVAIKSMTETAAAFREEFEKIEEEKKLPPISKELH